MDMFLWPELPVFQRWVSGWCRGSTRSKVDFENSTFFFFEADGSVTQSSLDFPDILIGYEVHEYYRRRIVDASVTGVLPSEITSVPTNSFHGVKSRDVGKESPQFIYQYVL